MTLELPEPLKTRLVVEASQRGVTFQECVTDLLESALPPVSPEDAIRLYAEGNLTQGQAADLARLSRAEFIDALGRAGVAACQYASADELIDEVSRG